MPSALADTEQSGRTEREDTMAIDIEANILRLAEGVARMEGGLQRVEQKLDLHILSEVEWREALDNQVKAKRGWWQLAISSLVSSGIIVTFFELIFRAKQH